MYFINLFQNRDIPMLLHPVEVLFYFLFIFGVHVYIGGMVYVLFLIENRDEKTYIYVLCRDICSVMQ